MEKLKIFKYLDDIVDAYQEPTERVTGLSRNPKDIIRTVEFYSNSKYLSGNTDSLGREKPFYNVGNYRVTVAKVATDLDVKDIRFEPDDLKFATRAMLINKKLYELLKEINFSKTLNDAGLTRPKYGGVILKKTERKSKLNIEVIDWTNIEFDPSDVLGGTLIETFYLYPSELIKQRGVWENIDDVLEAHEKATKGKPEKIEVKEVTGEFPKSFDPKNDSEEADDEYARMCFYIACVGKKKYLLYVEEEKEMRYKYLPWEQIGNSLGRGIWEDGFESQIWQNDAMISMKNAMDISGKVIIATDSQKISGNAITGVDNGHIFQIEQGRTVNSLNLAPSSMPQFERAIELWNAQYDKTASTFDANTGEAPTAGTPYSQTALLNQVANSPFEFRREEYGIFLNEVLNDWIMPYLKKKIKKEGILVADFDDEELDVIDQDIVDFTGVDYFKKALIQGVVPTEEEMQKVKDQQKSILLKGGKKRQIPIPEGYLDIEGKLTANITGELKNKQAILQSLDNIFKTIASTYNPATGTYSALEDPTLSKVFNYIIETAGIPISSVQLKPKPAQPQQPLPEQQPQQNVDTGRTK